MDISTSISSQHLHPGIRAWHALEHSHKQAWRGLATKLRRPPHEGLLERRSYCPRPRFCTQWASYDRHEKLQRAGGATTRHRIAPTISLTRAAVAAA